MNRLYLTGLLLLVPLLFHACAGILHQPPMRQDPLIDQIVETRTGRTVAFDFLIQALMTHDVIYLSEKHDNPAHHAMQERVLKALIDRGQTPALGFEFFSMEDTPDILNFLDSAKKPQAHQSLENIIETDLRKKLGWDTQPDHMWGYYYRLLTLARDNGLPAAGLDLPATLKKRITRKGLNDLSPMEKEMIFSTQWLDPAYQSYMTYMTDIFRNVHCGMDHASMQAKLYDAWIARNDRMAFSITRLRQHTRGPVVVIIGNGHTEYGLGVIHRVSALDPGIRQVNLAMTEISVTPTHLNQYLIPLDLEGYENTLPADFIFFTQRVSYTDPCETFRNSIKKMKRSGGEQM